MVGLYRGLVRILRRMKLLERQASFRRRLCALVLAGVALGVLPLLQTVPAAQAKTAAKKTAPKSTKASSAPAKTAAKATKKRVSRSPWKAPNFADSADGDAWEGDDPMVRQAAVDALGKLNGAVVVTDASTGRILTVVGQKTAYKDGFQPCSTIKVPVALAALSESLVDRLTDRKSVV